jgi:hypothetical protein
MVAGSLLMSSGGLKLKGKSDFPCGRLKLLGLADDERDGKQHLKLSAFQVACVIAHATYRISRQD